MDHKLKWYVEWNGIDCTYDVIKDGFHESHWSSDEAHLATERAKLLNDQDEKEIDPPNDELDSAFGFYLFEPMKRVHERDK